MVASQEGCLKSSSSRAIVLIGLVTLLTWCYLGITEHTLQVTVLKQLSQPFDKLPPLRDVFALDTTTHEDNKQANDTETTPHTQTKLKNITLEPVQRVDDDKDEHKLVLKARKEEWTNSSKPILAIVAATRSRPQWKSGLDTPLQKYLLPSLLRTVSISDTNEWDIRLYLGMDDDDTFWLNETHWLELLIPSYLTVHVYTFPNTENRIPFNEIAAVAYKDGASYFCRINDDTAFDSQQWIQKAVGTLQSFDPPNLGVVGPTTKPAVHAGSRSFVNRRILTHDFVHKTHLEIFHDLYYPSQFSNWYLDNWITAIYSRNVLGPKFHRIKMLDDWTVLHYVSRPRYKPSRGGNMNALYAQGLEQIRTYLQEHSPSHVKLLPDKKRTAPARFKPKPAKRTTISQRRRRQRFEKLSQSTSVLETNHEDHKHTNETITRHTKL